MFSEQQLAEIRDAIRERYPERRFALVWARDSPAGAPTEVQELDEGLYAVGIHVKQPADVFWQGDDAAWDAAFPVLRELRPSR